ncbi:MAG: ferritin family protein [Bacteroidales bacterium]|nr:ferritin family protein [Bacteroidales bacterium]
METFKSIDDILDFAIQSEQEAVDFYTGLADNARSEDMKQVFQQFAKEEMGHKAKLTNIKEQGLYEIKKDKVTDLKISDYVVNVEPSPDMNYQEALVVAMNKEKAAFRLYSDLADRAMNGDMRELFQSLALEESRHKLRFELEYDEFVLREN